MPLCRFFHDICYLVWLRARCCLGPRLEGLDVCKPDRRVEERCCSEHTSTAPSPRSAAMAKSATEAAASEGKPWIRLILTLAVVAMLVYGIRLIVLGIQEGIQCVHPRFSRRDRV